MGVNFDHMITSFMTVVYMQGSPQKHLKANLYSEKDTGR